MNRPVGWLWVAGLLPLLLSGCENSCQQICHRMAAYARDCGYEVSHADVAACVEAQAGQASANDRAVCRRLGGRADLRSQWTCDDVGAYFDAATTGAASGSSDTATR